MYEQTPSGNKELNLKVLDMGMGHERNAWFTKATSTSYESVFPTVCKKLHNSTGIKVDGGLMKRFLPYSSYLNIDEVENIDKTWVDVADKVGEDVKTLKEKILPLAALYSVGEHSRALLVALSDGALPSNVGGGYNLRVILRRALSFIDKYNWKVELADVCKWHAEYLKPLFPELSEHLDEVAEIIEVEKDKYEQTKQKSHQLIKKFIQDKIDNKKLLQLYDSQGINPEIIKEEALKLGKTVDVPENFYAKVAEMHEKSEQVHATKREEKLNLEGVQDTKALYFDDYQKLSNKAKVLKVIDKNVVLDQTVAYPTSGGQLHDLGKINGERVVDIFKQGGVIVHVLADKPKFKQGDSVEIKIDGDRRKQLAQHHTATHIVNAAAKRVLGSHINQAGAKKTEEKAHLDVTHFRNISEEELEKINEEANKIIKEAVPVRSSFMSRSAAEKKYGMGLYQGGAVPGKEIRVIEIPEIDVEACGGTHLKNTQEAEEIKILKSSKIQDGIVRITFTSGKAAEKEEAKEEGILEKTAKLLGVEVSQLPGRAQELFDKWKKARKAVKKGNKIDQKELELKSKEKFDGDVLAKIAEVLRTQPEVIDKTISRFLKELEEFKKKLK
jgi:alanyl-tRNA synthetase